jgi:threonine dehydrogenase-like Zn-dependent dehydrogenase
MKAWECRGGELGWHDVERPNPGPNEEHIQVRYTGICGSDLPKLLHPDTFTVPDPWLPGHEIIGTTRHGHWVAVDPLIPCRKCYDCKLGDTHLCSQLQRMGWDVPGGFTSEIAVPKRNVHRLAPTLSDSPIATLADAAAVAIHSVHCTPIKALGRVAVIGAGPLGLLTALCASDHRTKVTLIHRPGRPPLPNVVSEFPHNIEFCSTAAADDKRFDVVFDAATGENAMPIELAIRIVRDGGTVIVQNAYLPGVQLPTAVRDVFRRSISLAGVFSHCHRKGPGDFSMALHFLSGHYRQLGRLVRVAGALADLRSVLTDHAVPPGRHVLVVGGA